MENTKTNQQIIQGINAMIGAMGDYAKVWKNENLELSYLNNIKMQIVDVLSEMSGFDPDDIQDKFLQKGN